MSNRTVVVLTALDLEYQAVRETLTDLRLQRHPAGTRFEVGRLACADAQVARADGRVAHVDAQVALALVGKGNHPAAVLAERAIAEFDPAAVLFVGVAGSLWPSVALGDLVVATHVYAYHGGTSEDDGLKARPRAWEIAHGCDQLARQVARAGDWAASLAPPHPRPMDSQPMDSQSMDSQPMDSQSRDSRSRASRPRVHFGPIVAGEVVRDSTVSDHARWVRTHYNDALAIEMESAGVAQAAHLNNALPVMVVRGISDLADGSKAAADGRDWQARAAGNAAAFAAAFIALLAGEPAPAAGQAPGGAVDGGAVDGGAVDGGAVRAERAAGSPRPVHPAANHRSPLTVRNVARGNSNVVVQAGQVFGDVTLGFPARGRTTDLATQLADFRDRLGRARDAGRLDEETFAAAEEELAAITGDAAPQGRHRMVALKRLRGLTADVPDLAARLADLISDAGGAS